MFKLTGTGFVPATPFAAFNGQLGIQFGKKPNTDAFELLSEFTLGHTSNGINPPPEAVTLTVGTFTTTIPPGPTVKQMAAGREPRTSSMVSSGNIGYPSNAHLLPLAKGSDMNRTALKLLIVVTGAILAFEGPLWAENRDLGRIEFQSKCAVCHGIDAKGKGPLAAQLKTAPADLTGLAKKNGGTFPQNAVEQIIDGRQDVEAHGPRDMPVWGNRYVRGVEDLGRKTRQQALIDYLNHLQVK